MTRPSAHSPGRTFAYASRGSYAWMSMKLFGSLGSYDHPSFGSRETRMRISPSASHSHMIACKIRDRKSTRLNSSHGYISYAVFCLKKKKKNETRLFLETMSTRIRDASRSH